MLHYLQGRRDLPMVSLTSLGGAGTVTGSKHLLDHEGQRILVDCGLFQGQKELRLRNWEPLSIAANSIDAVVLTHPRTGRPVIALTGGTGDPPA